MLQRQVEPELMNGTDQVEAYSTADFSQSDHALVHDSYDTTIPLFRYFRQ